ncbi:O-antigen/teichoic acid export membrane protein [Mycetocola sp. BIGb0189]|uniref:hypothetical protein n=1 Tax=Mycetocola sp. BIGb0189 TaxID=2940604 RepID=UPI0021690EE9|nr:hypothetical protein [Mycetocola sp. BIGb0189]MCS4276774.1 O-antigen/teichoic acid export membrane protein [Mycetocola sp. BIGb0189]
MGNTTEYESFMAFWAAFYLVVGTLSGVQQEFTRASSIARQSPEIERGTRPGRYLVVAALIVCAVLALTGALWGPAVFGSGGYAAALFIAVGAGFYAVFAGLSGLLYGHERWGVLSLGIVADPLIRAIALTFAIVLGGLALSIQAAVVLPVALCVVLLLVAMRVGKNGLPALGMSWRALSWNTLRAMGGAAATAALVSGFPLFLKIAGEGNAALATIIFVFTIVRAPIVIPLLALQSFMIVHFTKNLARAVGSALRLILVIIAASVVLGGLGALIGPPIVSWITNGAFDPAPLLLFGMIASAGFTAGLCVSGSAAVATSRHGAFVVGWVVAAITSIALIFAPIDLATRTVLALSAGPLLGLVVHLLAIRTTRPDAVPVETGTPGI